jgi:integrase
MASVVPYPLPGDRPDRPTRWRVYFQGPGGKRVCRAFRGGKREAERWGQEQEAQWRARPAARPPSPQTLRDYLAEWLPAHAARQALRPRTMEMHAFLARNYIVPALGEVPLRELTAPRLRAWLDGLLTATQPSGRRLSSRTVALARTTLRLALAAAVDAELLPSNPMDAVRPPKTRPRPPQPLTEEETRAVLALAPTRRLGPLYTLCLHLGLRIGEALALRWEDVDLDGGTIVVRHTAPEPHSRRDAPAQARESHGPKTPAGIRTWPLPPPTLAALRAWRATRRAEAELLGTPVGPLVFTTRRGTPLHYRNVIRDWHALLQRAGIPRRGLHTTRHTAVSRAIIAGLTLPEVAAMAGHATPAITMRIYAHLLDPTRTEAARKQAAALASDPSPYADPYADCRIPGAYRRPTTHTRSARTTSQAKSRNTSTTQTASATIRRRLPYTQGADGSNPSSPTTRGANRAKADLAGPRNMAAGRYVGAAIEQDRLP